MTSITKYIVIHNTHNGCYDFQYYEDHVAKLKLTSITINPPKVFLKPDVHSSKISTAPYWVASARTPSRNPGSGSLPLRTSIKITPTSPSFTQASE